LWKTTCTKFGEKDAGEAIEAADKVAEFVHLELMKHN